jgi:hypothetical protein
MPNNGYGDYALRTIEDGQVPETRMRNASQVVDFVRRLWQNDEKRSWKRSRVNGLVDGNPPYRASKLRDNGRAEACNVNWGTARNYMEGAAGAFYDLATEAPGIVGVLTNYGNDGVKQDEYSRIMSAEADRIISNHESWDFETQVSQDQMTLHGRGPYFFEDPYKVFPIAIHDADLRVPERTRADTKYWEVCTIDRDYYPPELYEYIRDEAAATAVGWDVEFTKRVIENAMDVRQPDGRFYDWEFYQQEIKNNSLAYYDDSKVCHLSHCLWLEFNGRITHSIVQREAEGTTECNYLFFSFGRYGSFKEFIHPMYFDRGNGGYHHSVTGLGVKMFSGMEYENRLLCNLMDKSFAPKILFKPTTTEATQRFQVAWFGDYGVMPPGLDPVVNPIQGYLTDGLAMFNTSSGLMRQNLASYRQGAPMKQEGNPPTARQVMYDATQSSSLSKTTYARFYKQMDALYAEMVRRMCDLNSTDEHAKEFQKRCRDQGVPEECFGKIERVRAVRVVGQGSAFMRKAAVDGIGAYMGSMPEEGRQNWLNDKIAAEAGQEAVSRYNPKLPKKDLASEQQFEALEGVTMMKVGVPPIPTSSQNPLTFAGVYLTAATQALQSLQKGADPMQVLNFLELCGPAILAHLKRFAKDPLRRQAFKEILKQWQQLTRITDNLKRQVMAQQKKMQAQKQKTQQAMSDQQIKMMQLQGDLQVKRMKTQAQIQDRAIRTRQDLAIGDARAASDIHRNNMRAFME